MEVLLHAALAPLAFGACGVSGGRAGPEPTDTAAPLYRQLCGYLERCHPELAATFADSSFEACRDFATCADPAAHWEKSFEDPVGCAAFVRDAACDAIAVGKPGGLTPAPFFGSVVFDLGAGCPRLTRGQASASEYTPPGGRCLTPGEGACDPEHFCSRDVPEQMLGLAYCGTCAPGVPEGGTCDGFTACTRGLRCIDGTCRMLLDTGAPCDQPAQCASYDCEDGACVERPSTGPRPIPPLEDYVGRACSPRDRADPCFESPLTDCVGGVCALRADAGESCDSLFGLCRVGQVCHEGVCVEVGCTSEIGEPCRGGFCDEGDCGFETDLCVAPPTLDAPCNTTCRAPYVCDLLQGICIERRVNGEGCKDDVGCQSGFCDRDYSQYCTPSFCSIPACDDVCGICAAAPTVDACR